MYCKILISKYRRGDLKINTKSKGENIKKLKFKYLIRVKIFNKS